MTPYTFEQLSPLDFEQLCRDLIQERDGLILESFGPGRDEGIDLRGRSTDGPLIVQCKHYRQSGFGRLLSATRKELAKVKKLQPARYLLCTSVSLTPMAKGKLVAELAPFCRGPEDILGCDDLNNLLGLFPEIERRHFKLWLTSSVVLETVLNAGVFAESRATTDSIRRRVSRFVATPALGSAADTLERERVCVIAGMPGIGKTTLAGRCSSRST